MARGNIFGSFRWIIAAALGGAVVGSLLVFLNVRPLAVSPVRAEPADADRREVKGGARPPAVLTVVTCYPGMPPDSIDKTITRRVALWLGAVPGVTSSVAKSIAGVSMVKLMLGKDADVALTLAQVNALMPSLRDSLPPRCPAPLVQLGDPASTPVLGLVAVRNPGLNEADLADIARIMVRPMLARVPGVRAPLVVGGKQRQIAIYLKPAEMEARHLSVTDVTRALEKNKVPEALGTATFGDNRVLLDTVGSSIRELLDLPLRTGADAVHLRDVGTIKDFSAPQTSLVRLNGKRIVFVPVFRSGPDATPGELRKVVGRLEALSKGTILSFLPCGDGKDGPREITVYVRAPSNLGLAAAERRIMEVERFLQRAIPAAEREWIVSELGVRADPSALYTQNAGPQDATIRVRLATKHSHSAAEYAIRLRQLFAKEAKFADLRTRFRAGPVVFAALDRGAVADLDILIQGGTREEQLTVARRLGARVRAVSGAADVQILQRQDAPYLLLDVDRVKAATVGLSPAEILQQAIGAMNSTTPFNRNLWLDAKSGNRYFVAIRYPENPTNKLEDIQNAELTGGNLKVPIKVSSVVAFRRMQGPVEITRLDGFLVVDVLIDVAKRDIGAVADEIEKIVRAQKTPERVRLTVRRLTADKGR